MNTFIDFRQDWFCVVAEDLDGDSDSGFRRIWYPVRKATPAEVSILKGRPVKQLDSEQGTYLDDEGNVYQLLDKSETKPMEIEHFSGSEKADLEALLEASLAGRESNGQVVKPKLLLRKDRRASRKHSSLNIIEAAPVACLNQAPKNLNSIAPDLNGPAAADPVRLNLRQKLAEVRRRIGYIQKRGHNERFNYSYVTAADIAGTVGDILSELGVIVIPGLENITYESVLGRGEQVRMARVVMAYTFSDVDTGEEIVAKVAGQGQDWGDKAPYKAMTGALKYALLQSFLLATGDDPEDEHAEARIGIEGSERLVNSDEICELEKLIKGTATQLEKVLAYYKVASLQDMTEVSYRRAVDLLNRKLANNRSQETVHGQD